MFLHELVKILQFNEITKMHHQQINGNVTTKHMSTKNLRKSAIVIEDTSSGQYQLKHLHMITKHKY